MGLVSAVGADEQPASVVEPGEGALDDPALAAEPGAVVGSAARDHGFDPAPPEEATLLVVVVAAVSDQAVGAPPGAADAAAYRRHAVEQVEQLRDLVAVAAGQRPGKRQSATVYEQMVFAAATAPVDGAGTRFRAPFFACT